MRNRVARNRESGRRAWTLGRGTPGTAIPDAASPGSGFTLVELLVVIVIIAILASLVMVGLSATMSSSRASSTEAMLTAIAGACAQYAQRWGDFPPSTLRDMNVAVPNDRNNGVESLVACLSSELRGGVLYRPSGDDQYSNTDDDRLTKNPNKWYFGDPPLLREIVDYFGNPITYLHHRDFARPRPEVLKYQVPEAKEPVEIRPETSPQTNTWVNAGRFQLRSLGADGKPATGDDLRAGH